MAGPTVADTGPAPKRPVSTAVRIGGALLCAGVALVSYRYVAQLGPVPPNIALNRWLNPAIAVHAGAAATALLIGPFQFLQGIRRRWPIVHRWIGRIYVTGCLIGGAAALVLAAGISSGPFASVGFATLGVLWIYVSIQGWITARKRRFQEHRRWMIRSFALTFAAVTLRLDLAVILSLDLDFLSAYRVIAWLSWVPNAICAELYLAKFAQGGTVRL